MKIVHLMRQLLQRSEPSSRRLTGAAAKTICSCPQGDPGLEEYWEKKSLQLLRQMGIEDDLMHELHWIGWQAYDGLILEHFRPCGTKARFAVPSTVAEKLEALSKNQDRIGWSGKVYQEKPLGGCRCPCTAMFRLIYPDGRVYPIRVELVCQQNTVLAGLKNDSPHRGSSCSRGDAHYREGVQ